MKNIFHNNKDKVAFFMPTLGGGGAERVIVNIINELSKHHNNIDLILAKGFGEYKDEINNSINIINLSSNSIWKSFIPFYNYIREVRPKYLLSTLPYTNIIAVLVCMLIKDPPKLILREANTVSQMRKYPDSFREIILPQLVKLFYPRADKIIAVSNGVRDDLVANINLDPEHVITVYNPIVGKEIIEYAKEQVTDINLDSNEKIVISVGRLNEQKDHKTLLEAFKLVNDQVKSKLIILGKGKLEYELKNYVQSLNLNESVKFMGFQKNPFKYMANADVLVLSSKYEGLPGVLIQAMAVGCPVVSTNCPSGPKEILGNGKWGTLVPVGDSKKMAEAILNTFSNKISEKSLINRASYFSKSKNTKKYIEVILNS